MVMPKSQKKGLVVKELADETLVYDLKRHRAYCLNRAASLVWNACDGHTSVSQIAATLQGDMDLAAAESVVWLALKRLSSAQLLEPDAPVAALARRYTRRQVLIAVGAIALVPIVLSVPAPAAAQAASCVDSCVGMPQLTPCPSPQCNKICCGPTGPSADQCKPNIGQC
jgi:hypothetical protein